MNTHLGIDFAASVLAQSISNGILETQGKLSTLYGPNYLNDLDEMDNRWEERQKQKQKKADEFGSAYHEEEKPNRRRNISKYTKNVRNGVHIAERGDPIQIVGNSKESLLLYGLVDSEITIIGKTNNIVMSKCENVVISLETSLTGIKIFKCKNVRLNIESIKYLGISTSNKIIVNGGVAANSMITLYTSDKCKVNGSNIPLDMFDVVTL
ncbi:MAG: hypothetical protein COA94_09200 [Rickettsiales bacterium]|nr:MAG: hypothetical protein COA94_09200 [Rickettsiales bacterium]